jgi:hypothetical protein
VYDNGMGDTTPAAVVLRLRNLIHELRTLSDVQVLDCLNSIREIPPEEWRIC